MILTEIQIEELSALMETNDAIGKSFLRRNHWHQSGYRELVRRGLVAWDDPPEGFNKRMFAGVTITDKGRRFIAGLSTKEKCNG